MSVQEVTMYRLLCDGCGGSASDLSDFYAWADIDSAVTDAQENDWYTAKQPDGSLKVLCEGCAPRCAFEDCLALLDNDEPGPLCDFCRDRSGAAS